MGGRRKRRKIKRQKQIARVLRTRYFICPVCSEQTLTIDFVRAKEGSRTAIVRCGSCGLYCELASSEIEETVDVYNRISDLAYEDKLHEICTERLVEGREEMVSEVEEGFDESTGEEE